jgi:hypothetical protein
MRCPAATNQELTEQDHRLILDLGAICLLSSGSKESVPVGNLTTPSTDLIIPSIWDASDFAAKRLHRTAEVLTLVRWFVKGALPARHSFALSSEGGKVAPDFGRASRNNTMESPKNAPRPPLSGRISRYA